MAQAPFQERNPTIKNGKKSYTVMKGDNLTRYASRNNTTIEELMKLNPHIKNKDKIYIGDEIILPGDWNDDGSAITTEDIETDIVTATNNTDAVTGDVITTDNTTGDNTTAVSDTQANWNKLKADQKNIRRQGRKNTLEFFDPTNTHDERMANISQRHQTKMDRIQNRWARRAARRDMRNQRRTLKQDGRELLQDLRSMNPRRLDRLDAQNERKHEKFGENAFEGNWADLSWSEKQKIRKDQRHVNRLYRDAEREERESTRGPGNIFGGATGDGFARLAQTREDKRNLRRSNRDAKMREKYNIDGVDWEGNWGDLSRQEKRNIKSDYKLFSQMDADIAEIQKQEAANQLFNQQSQQLNNMDLVNQQGLRHGGPVKYQNEGIVDTLNPIDPMLTYAAPRDTLWHSDIQYMSNPPQYNYTTTDPHSGEFKQGRGMNPDGSGTWTYPQNPNFDQKKLDMFFRNQMIDTGGSAYTMDLPPVEFPAPGGEMTEERKKGGPVNFYSGGGPLKYASYGTNELPDAWQPTGNIVYNEGAQEIANAQTQNSMNTAQVVNSKMMEIEDPNRVGETGAQISQGVTQAVKSSPGMTNFFQNVGDYGFKHGFESLRSPSNPFYQQSKMPRWMMKDIAQSNVTAMPNTTVTMADTVGQQFAQKPLEELTKDAIAEQGGHLLDEVVLTGTKAGEEVGKTAATNLATEGAKSHVATVAPYSMVGSLLGTGIKMASDDQDPTTMNVGETAGGVLSGASTGAGFGSLFGPAGTIAGGLIGGLWSGLAGKKKRDDAREDIQEIYDDVVQKHAYTGSQAKKLAKTYYGSDMGKRLKVRLGGIPYKYGGTKMKAYA